MPISLVCASCDHRCKVADDLAGRRVKCPRCGAALSVPDDGAGERPNSKGRRRDEGRGSRPRPARKASNKGLVIGLAVGCGVLVVLLIGGGVLLFVFFRGGGGFRDSPNATEENFDKIKPGMSQEEVEKVLGKGEKVSYNAVNEALHARPSKKPSTGDANTYRWKNKGDTILLIIDPSREGPFKGVVLGWFVREQNGGQPKIKMLGSGKPE